MVAFVFIALSSVNTVLLLRSDPPYTSLLKSSSPWTTAVISEARAPPAGTTAECLSVSNYSNNGEIVPEVPGSNANPAQILLGGVTFPILQENSPGDFYVLNI